MSLATACPSCGTVFRVVQDQLKVSDGWVRCGHCQKIFNAVEHLFDLDSRRTISSTPARRPQPDEVDEAGWQETSPAAFSNESLLRQSRASRNGGTTAGGSATAASGAPARSATQEAPAPAKAAPPAGRATAAPPAAAREPDTPAGSPLHAPSFDFELPSDREAQLRASQRKQVQMPLADAIGSPTSAAVAAGRDAGDAATSAAMEADAFVHDDDEQSVFPRTAMFGMDEPAGDPLMQDIPQEVSRTVAQPQPTAQMLTREDVPATASADIAAEPSRPDFLRDADRQARWRQPWVRAGLSLLALLLGGALAAQVTYQSRDRIAARWPQSKPLLTLACQHLACRINPPRLIDAIVVDNTALTRPPGVDGYRLSVVLRNRAEHLVAAPHLELSLTDTTGAVVVKRVFSPADFRITQPELAAQSDATWTLAFQAAGQNIAGYTLAAFYP